METNKRPTQCERIVQYMKDFGEISSQQAMTDLGVYRLASRISELKEKGYAIKRRIEKSKNRYGEPTAYAVYSLDEGKAI